MHGIRCTLVDPRPLKLSKPQQRRLQQEGLRAVVHTLTQQQLEAGGVLPEWERPSAQHPPSLGMGSDAFAAGEPAAAAAVAAAAAEVAAPASEGGDAGAAVEQEGETTAAAAGGWEDAAAASAEQPGQCKRASQLHFYQVKAWFGPQLWRSSGWQRIFGGGSSSGSGSSGSSGGGGGSDADRNSDGSSNGPVSGSGSRCSLVVGLHPDQATDPILEFALETGCPFAIVPCCVFPRLFSHRRLPTEGGQPTPVTSYLQLVEYLVSRGGAQQLVLGFEGANTVVYRT